MNDTLCFPAVSCGTNLWKIENHKLNEHNTNSILLQWINQCEDIVSKLNPVHLWSSREQKNSCRGFVSTKAKSQQWEWQIQMRPLILTTITSSAWQEGLVSLSISKLVRQQESSWGERGGGVCDMSIKQHSHAPGAKRNNSSHQSPLGVHPSCDDKRMFSSIGQDTPVTTTTRQSTRLPSNRLHWHNYCLFMHIATTVLHHCFMLHFHHWLRE